jgi:hypothetical protein
MPPRYLAVANPAGKRWQAFQRDLFAFWAEQGVTPTVEVLPWSDVVPRLGDLSGMTDLQRPAEVRLESPGRDAEVKRLLLRAGGVEPTPLADRKGHLTTPAALFRGFRRVLLGLRATFDAHPALRPSACPLEVAALFDKTATAARLAAAGLPVPPHCPPPATAQELLEAVRECGWPVAYVKLNTGSSASGQVALHALDDPPWGVSTMVRLAAKEPLTGWPRHSDGEFYNTRRLQRITGDELSASLDFLLREGACVQRGIPLAQIDGQNFDVRVVVIHGEPRFTIFRLSPHPMTNLHLGGRRGDPALCRSAVPTRAWLDALDDCAGAADLYRCSVVGVDLLFERGYPRHYLLEVNAFGDWFPDLTDERGRSVHRTEIEEGWRKRET